MSELVTYRTEGGVAVFTLTNPPANAYSYEMMQALDGCILRARMDDDVHVILITGEGDKFFCAGADISMLNDVTPSFKYNFCLHANETLNRLEQTPKLVIAALNGHTVGGGLEVALACDLRLGREGKAKLGLPEINLGVLPGTGGTQRLARLVGKSKAIELMVTGRNFGVAEAQRLGLVNETLESHSFLADALKYAQQFVPPTGAAMAAGRIKRAVCSGLEMPFGEGLALERELQQQLFQSADANEGISAYVEKRVPKFTGS